MGIHMSSEKKSIWHFNQDLSARIIFAVSCDLQIVLFRFGKYLKQTSSTSDVLQLNREMSF